VPKNVLDFKRDNLETVKTATNPKRLFEDDFQLKLLALKLDLAGSISAASISRLKPMVSHSSGKVVAKWRRAVCRL
jgi:hypothetical protein